MASKVNRDRRWAAGVCGFATMIAIGAMIWCCLPPPQLRLDDEQVIHTVDALFTALTSRDLVRLDECDSRLKSYHTDGRTSKAAAAVLNSVVLQAREGEWEHAARRLYDFILGQRGKPTG